jgi:hypothetical protein
MDFIRLCAIITLFMYAVAVLTNPSYIGTQRNYTWISYVFNTLVTYSLAAIVSGRVLGWW